MCFLRGRPTGIRDVGGYRLSYRQPQRSRRPGVVGKVNVGGRGLTASCGPNPGPDVKISTETNGSGLVTAAAAAAFTSVLGMLSSSLLGVLVSAAAATRSLSLLPGVAMTSTAALTTGVTGSVKR